MDSNGTKTAHFRMEELHKIQLELAELQKRICPELMLLSESAQVPQWEPESDRLPESTLFRVESQLLECKKINCQF